MMKSTLTHIYIIHISLFEHKTALSSAITNIMTVFMEFVTKNRMLLCYATVTQNHFIMAHSKYYHFVELNFDHNHIICSFHMYTSLFKHVNKLQFS